MLSHNFLNTLGFLIYFFFFARTVIKRTHSATNYCTRVFLFLKNTFALLKMFLLCMLYSFFFVSFLYFGQKKNKKPERSFIFVQINVISKVSPASLRWPKRSERGWWVESIIRVCKVSLGTFLCSPWDFFLRCECYFHLLLYSGSSFYLKQKIIILI